MEDLIVIRGGGDIATGVVQKLYRSGFRVVILETSKPMAIRRTVCLCEAVYNNEMIVEDVQSRLVYTIQDALKCHDFSEVPILIDTLGKSINEIRPNGVIDAILAKRNLGTTREMAPITIGLGPGFTAGYDVNAVIETVRGHNLGRLILKGRAMTNTGVPGEIGGKSSQRVIHAPIKGKVCLLCEIGEILHEGQPILSVSNNLIRAPFKGLVRGLIQSGTEVSKGMKIGDIDPRTDVDIHTISDKSRCLGGAVLEAYIYLKRMQMK